jgi:hypothetical protein
MDRVIYVGKKHLYKGSASEAGEIKRQTLHNFEFCMVEMFVMIRSKNSEHPVCFAKHSKDTLEQKCCYFCGET